MSRLRNWWRSLSGDSSAKPAESSHVTPDEVSRDKPQATSATIIASSGSGGVSYAEHIVKTQAQPSSLVKDVAQEAGETESHKKPFARMVNAAMSEHDLKALEAAYGDFVKTEEAKASSTGPQLIYQYFRFACGDSSAISKLEGLANDAKTDGDRATAHSWMASVMKKLTIINRL